MHRAPGINHHAALANQSNQRLREAKTRNAAILIDVFLLLDRCLLFVLSETKITGDAENTRFRIVAAGSR
jgi:hypothetical protein